MTTILLFPVTMRWMLQTFKCPRQARTFLSMQSCPGFSWARFHWYWSVWSPRTRDKTISLTQSLTMFLSFSLCSSHIHAPLSLSLTHIHWVSGTYTLYLSNTFTRTQQSGTAGWKTSTLESIMAIRWLQSYNQRFKVEFRGRETASIVFLRAGDRYTSNCPGMTESQAGTLNKNIGAQETLQYGEQEHSDSKNIQARQTEHYGMANIVVGQTWSYSMENRTLQNSM